jgi:hypothetical protein
VRHRDNAEGRRVRDQLRTYKDIAFVKDISDLEMHGDGVVIWPRYKTEVPKLIPHRWSRDMNSHGNRFDRYNRGIVKQVVDWHFSNRPENLVDVCERAFAELEKIIQQELRPNTGDGLP